MASRSAQPNRRIRRWLVDYPRAVPVVIFLLVAVITALSVFAIERGEGKREQAELRERARTVAIALERRANSSSAYLRAGAAMFSSVDKVDAPLFDRFVSELQLDFEARGAEGIGWTQSVLAGDIDRFEQSVRSARGSGFMVRPALEATRARAFPVTYLLPDTERNRRALGFDMYSDPTRRSAMDEAERSVRPTASGMVVLEQEGSGTVPGFLIYMPVFQGDFTDRRLLGFVYSPFNAVEFLDAAIELVDEDERGVRLYDERKAPDRLLAAIEPENATGLTVSQPIAIASRPMVVEIESAKSATLSLLSMATLIFGLLVASLLMVVARLVTQQAREDQDTLDWLAEQHSIRDSLTRELNHRVKNTLANVLSIVSLTRRRSSSLDEFADGLDGRIRALSATHDLLTQSEWGTTPIQAVVEAELAPYARAGCGAFDLVGPAVELAPNDALVLGMAIHELAANASKYGALSKPDGSVRVRWELETPDIVRLDWREAGGPPVAGDRKRGFGMDLIERIVAHELDHPVELSFAPGGVHCRLFIPIRLPNEFAMRAQRRAKN